MELTKIQKDIAFFDNSGPLIVKGTAGSGKTIVGLSRVPFLKERFCRDEKDKILIITYTKTLINYLEYLTEFLGLDKVQKTLKFSDTSKVEVKILNADKLIYGYTKDAFGIVNDGLKKMFIKNIAMKIGKENSHNLLKFENIDFLIEEIDWIRDCNFVEKQDYLNCDRIGRGKGKRLGKNSESRKIVFEVMKQFRKKLKERSQLDLKERNLYTLNNLNILEMEKYDHIIVDEAQDLSKVQLEIINNLQKKENNSSTLMYLYDSSQSIYEGSWLGQGRTFKSIGLNIRGRSRILTKSFRTPKEVHIAAHSMLTKDKNISNNDGYINPDFTNPNGIKPFYKNFKSFEEQIEYISNIIKSLNKKYGYKNIMIATKIRAKLFDISQALREKGIVNEIIDPNKKYDFNDDKISLTTLHSIKGLESKVIILTDLNDDVIPKVTDMEQKEEQISNERKLLYVGMTRASEILHLCSWGKESSFIKDIDNEYINYISGDLDEFERKLIDEGEKYQDRFYGKNIEESGKYKILLKKLKELEDINKKDNSEIKSLRNNNKSLENHKKILKEENIKLKEKELELSREIEHKFTENLFNKKYIDVEKEIFNRYKLLSPLGIKTLALAEYSFENIDKDIDDYSGIYLYYCKVIEIELKEYILTRPKNYFLERELTFGKILNEIEQYYQFKKITVKLKKIKAIKLRNDAAHIGIISKNDCIALRNFLINEKGLIDILRLINIE